MSLTDAGSSTETMAGHRQPYVLMSQHNYGSVLLQSSHTWRKEEELSCRTKQVQMLVVEFEISFLLQSAINYY